ncbi:Nucleoside permease nupX [Candidatus Ornithobacterium hominis]|uniref:Nucleoside permease nupX n=1 Tax=Candidatus Ornithobacterium hominis TaxID=2497989 RepID=A0A383TWV2_9FLAO|nr:nucleoside transporter C-terminal domain-containing protein [Candidatus Ornithobacterium hominis]SZD71649.1 Nucleoside permease nupX [Candidatus Ornithobacterium hominis]SZD72250.1 Nucleoside permease nupX [Candidatus Ornithobacterium hominis]
MEILRGVLGIIVILGIAFLFSKKKSFINWKTIFVGLVMQLILAIGILKGDTIGFDVGNYRFDFGFIGSFFDTVGKIFIEILNYTKAGTTFLLGNLLDDNSFGYIFAFQVLPVIIFFSALTSVLFYFGIIQAVVKFFAKGLKKILGTSGPESLSVTGNIFLGQTEAPLMIKEYLSRMTKSEILLVMIGGMATVAGSVLGAYINFLGGNDPVEMQKFARHLLAASVMAAPGAVVVAKLLYPQIEKPTENLEVKMENVGTNFLEALSNGTSEGLKLAVNVAAMLLVFIAMIAMVNGILGWVGEVTHLNEIIAAHTIYKTLSLEMILGYLFAPLMWLIGVPTTDISLMGQLLGIKLVASEFIAYGQLAELKNTSIGLALTSQKSIIMATYMLCGFANFASIGIQIGGIGSLAPSKRVILSEFGLRALLGGTLASLLSATIAGILLS